LTCYEFGVFLFWGHRVDLIVAIGNGMQAVKLLQLRVETNTTLLSRHV